MLCTLLGAATLVAIVAAALALQHSARRRQRQREITLHFIHVIATELNRPQGDLAVRIRQFLEENPDYAPGQRRTNCGAEIMYAVFGRGWTNTSDNDHDGRLEACDENGDPLIFLSPGDEPDTIIRADGTRVPAPICPPPYGITGYYLDTLMRNLWLNNPAALREYE